MARCGEDYELVLTVHEGVDRFVGAGEQVIKAAALVVGDGDAGLLPRVTAIGQRYAAIR